jgi:hypothetical protein
MMQFLIERLCDMTMCPKSDRAKVLATLPVVVWVDMGKNPTTCLCGAKRWIVPSKEAAAIHKAIGPIRAPLDHGVCEGMGSLIE